MNHRPPLPTTFYGRRKSQPRIVTERLAQALNDFPENKKAKREQTSSMVSPSTTAFASSQIPVEKSTTATPSKQQRLPKTRPQPLNDKSNIVASFASPSVSSPALKPISPSVVVRSTSVPTNSPPRTQSSNARRRSRAPERPFVWVDKEDTVNVKREKLKERGKKHGVIAAEDNRRQALKSKLQLVKRKAKEEGTVVAEKQIPVDGPSAEHSTLAENYGFTTATLTHDDSHFESPRELPSDSDMDIPASEGPSIDEFVPIPRPTSQVTRLDDDVRPHVSFSTVCAVSTPIVGGPKRFYHRSVRTWIDGVGDGIRVADEDVSGGRGSDRVDERADTEADTKVDAEADTKVDVEAGQGVDEAEDLLSESIEIETEHEDILHTSSDESDDPLVSSVAEICHIPSLRAAATSIEATGAATESDLSRTKKPGLRMFSIETALEQTESDDELYATYG